MPTFRAESNSSTKFPTTSSIRPIPHGRYRLLPQGIFALLVFLNQACSGGGSDPVIVSDGPNKQPRGSLTVEPADFLVTEGETLKMTAKLGGTVVGAGQVSWSVSPSNVATIDAYGTLTAVKHGEATVTARYSSVQGTSLGTVRAIPERIRPVVTTDQVGIVGRAIHDSIGIRAESKDGVPVPGVDVTFDAPTGQGTLSHTVRTTGSDGVARVEWRLGTGAGMQSFRAHAGALGEVTIQAEALADYDSARVVPLSGDGQEGVVATYLPEVLTAQITDQFENLLPGMGLLWSFGSGGGVDASQGGAAPATQMLLATADGQALTRVRWKLGTLAGEQGTVLTPVSGPSSASPDVNGPQAGSANGEKKGWYKWRANGKAADPDMVLVTPEEVWGLVGEEKQLQATLADAFGNPIEGGTFTWRVDNSNVLELRGPGLVKGLKEGRAAVLVESDVETLTGSAWVNVAARVPTALQRHSGDGQTGEVASTLPSPVSLRVLDQGGAPVVGADVMWRVVAGPNPVSGFGPTGSPAAGEPTSPVTVTNQDGIAQTSWVLGTQAGDQVLEAVVGELQPLKFTAHAEPGAVVSIALDPAQAEIPTGLSKKFTVLAEDGFGNKISGLPVAWTSTDPGVADFESEGSVRGKAVGSAEIRASSGGVTGTALAVVVPGGPSSAAVAGGDGQVGPAGQALPQPLRLGVFDSNGAPVPGVEVTWTVKSGEGSVREGTTVTSSQGIAETVWTLGTSVGENRVEATVGELAPVSFSASAQPGPAASVSVVPGVVTMQVGFVGQFVASALDQFGNSIPGAAFTWSVSSATVASVDQTGKVTARAAGSATLTARTGEALGTAELHVTDQVVDALQIVGGNEQSGPLGSVLPNPLRIRAVDGFGEPLGGANVTWRVESGGGSISPERAKTDPEGYAESTWTLGGQAGAQTVSVSLDTGGSVAFSSTATLEPRIEISPSSLTFSALNQTATLSATVFDALGETIPDAIITWSSSDTGIATISSGGVVTSKAWGQVLIVASAACCSASDTALVAVEQAVVSPPVVTTSSPIASGKVGQSYNQLLTASGGDGTYTWSLAGGDPLPGGLSLMGNEIRGTPSQAGTATFEVRVTSVGQSATKSLALTIAPSEQVISGDTIDLQILRLDGGSGEVLVSSGIPLTPGLLRPGETSNLTVLVNGVEKSIYVEELTARNQDGSLRSVLVQFRASVGSSPLSGQLIVGPQVHRGTTDLGKTPFSGIQPAAVALPTSAEYLVGTGIVGPTIPASQTPSLPYYMPQYESELVQKGDYHWSIEPPEDFTHNYYDRALVWFAWWVRTGHAEYWRRGVAQAGYYQNWFEEAIKINVAPRNQAMEGIELRYLLLGDEAARYALLRAAEVNDYYWDGSYASAPGGDGRIQSRTLTSYVIIHRNGDTSRPWAAKAGDILQKILDSQNPSSGAYDLFSASEYMHSPYQTGMVHEAMTLYYDWIDPDPRILPSMKAAMDYEWNNMWVPATNSFKYLPTSTSGSPDLNGLIINGYGWYYMMTGDAAYLQRGEAIMQGLVDHAWIDGTKQFNQTYRSSYRYLYYR